jgi:hypothetical protein
MCCYVRNVLPRVRLVSLVRLCYVSLLPCYLGGILNVQPFLQKKTCCLFCSWKDFPLQTTVSLASETFVKKIKSRSCLGVYAWNLSAFRDRGVPEPMSECAACPSPDGSSAWASAKGGEARWPETGVREVEISRPSCSSRAQVGCACSRGVTSVHAGEGSERP